MWLVNQKTRLIYHWLIISGISLILVILYGSAVQAGIKWNNASNDDVKRLESPTIEISPTTDNTTVKVTLLLGNPNCERISWGQTSRVNNRIIADATLEWAESTDPANPIACTAIISYESHTYELGKMKDGNYNFVFKILGQEKGSKEFTIQSISTNNNTSNSTKTKLVSTGLSIYFWPLAVLGAIIIAGVICWIIQKIRISQKK